MSDGIEALSEVPGVAEREVGAVADEARDQVEGVAGLVREAGHVPSMSAVADEIEAVSARMQSVLGDLPDAVTGVVQDEIGNLQALLTPEAPSSRTDRQAPGLPGLADLPEFETPGRMADRDSGGSDGASGDEASPRVVEFATEAEFNTAAESPQPHTTYRYRDVEWRTDELARTISVTGAPRLEPATRRPGMQANIGNKGRPTDVGFHLLGHALGGPTNPINVVAGNGQRIEDGLANLNQGAYAIMERSVRAALADDLDVWMEIKPTYHPRNRSRRPDEFHVRVVVDGEPEDFIFINK